MKEMLSGSTSLNEINFNIFNTDNVTNMSYTFFKCESLKKLNLSKFNINNVANMPFMFSECSTLNILNLITFDTLSADAGPWPSSAYAERAERR